MRTESIHSASQAARENERKRKREKERQEIETPAVVGRLADPRPSLSPSNSPTDSKNTQAAAPGISPRHRTSAAVFGSLGRQQQQRRRRRPLLLLPLSLSPRPPLGLRLRGAPSAPSAAGGDCCGHSHDAGDHEHHEHERDSRSHAHSHGSHDHDHEGGEEGGSCCSSSSSSSSSCDDEEDGHHHHHHHHHDDNNSSKLPRGAAERLARGLADALGLSALSRKLSHSVPALSAAAAALLLAAGADSSFSASLSMQSPLILLPLLPSLKTFLAAAAYVLAGLPDLLELFYTLLAALPRKGKGGLLFLFPFPFDLGQGPLAALQRVDTHSLMSASAAAAAVLGSPLEGALLLVLFGFSHALESRLASRARGDLKGLLASSPPGAVLVEMTRGGKEGEEEEGLLQQPDLSSTRAVAASEVEVGQVTLVRPGEACAHDGVVVWGSSLVSAEHITGESLPRRASVGDLLPAGAVSRDGALALECTAAAKDSAPARIAALAAAAQRSKPPLAAWLDKVGAAYSRGVLVASLGAFLVLLALGVPLGSSSAGVGAAAMTTHRGAAYRAMALLTAASPCALALAPLAYVAAVATAARRGVVLRGGGATLDALLGVRGVGLDKTGTLTTGELRCVGQVSVEVEGAAAPPSSAPSSPPDDSSPLATAAALALRSTHPVSAALVAAAKGAGIEPLPPAALSAFELVAGSGVKAKLSVSSSSSEEDSEAATVFLGSAEWVAAALVAAAEERKGGEGGGASAAAAAKALLAAAAETEAGAVIVSAFAKISSSSSPSSPSSPSSSSPPPQVSLFAFEDAVRALSSSAVASLRSGRGGGGGSERRGRPPLSLRVLTGDSAASALRVARSLGIDAGDLRSGLSPEGKVAALRELREQVNDNRDDAAAGEGRKGKKKGKRKLFGVMMVGDGVNDAPALAAADVGVALSSSSSSSSSVSSSNSSSTRSSNPSTTTTAQELAADVLLLGGSGIEQLPFLLDLAAFTRKVVSQNLAIAAGSVAVLALPALCGFLPLWLAVALHEGSTLVVALNSLRPLAFRGGDRKGDERRRRDVVASSSPVDLSSAAAVVAAAPRPPSPPVAAAAAA